MRILPVRRGVLRPARRAMCRAGRFCAACRCYAGFCARCPGAFSLLQPRRLCVRLPAGAPAFRGFVSRPAGSLPLLRLACAAGACLPFACHALVCAGLLLPLFGLFGSPRRSAGRCCRPASARKASCRCARIPQLCFRFAPGLRVLLPAAFARTFTAAVCLPSVRLCVRAFMLLSFALFLPHFCLSKFFSFVAHAATGTPFSFRKENGGKEPRGGATAPPSNPHSCALRPIFFSSALLAGLRGPLGRKPPADGETLEKPGSRAQLFKRFCAKEDACALRLFSPFFSLLAGLVWPFGPQIAGWRGNARKAKGAELSFSSVSVRWGRAGASSLPGKTGAVRGRAPGISRVRARMGADANTERDLPTAGVLTAGAGFLPAAGNRN